MSLPNCCNVVRKRFSLQSCRAPQAGGSCWLDSEAVEDMAGPLLKPLGVDGAPFSDVGEWLLPFSTADKQAEGRDHVIWGQLLWRGLWSIAKIWGHHEHRSIHILLKDERGYVYIQVKWSTIEWTCVSFQPNRKRMFAGTSAVSQEVPFTA